MQSIKDLIGKYTPQGLQAKATKALAVLGVVLGLCVASYFYGAHNANSKWDTKIAKQKTEIAELKAKNASAAATRFGDYVIKQTEIVSAIAAAKQEVHAYYKANPVDPRIVEKTKLVPVPGKEEYVYVPIGTCPNDLFGPDELRLWNKGNNPDAFDPR